MCVKKCDAQVILHEILQNSVKLFSFTYALYDRGFFKSEDFLKIV